ncbi:MAG TPA: FeoA family protein [Acidobacteriaceae bacterium]|nr:FeoA family protein [Acidobacteriaceae bacterium]
MRKLIDLEVGESGVLVALDLPPGVQNHLMYMGFVPDAHVRVLHRSPMGDPTVYAVDGIEVALRMETAKAIQVKGLGRVADVVPQPRQQRQADENAAELHPELIEAGR